MFYIGLYRENMKKFFLSETTRPRALIFHKAYSLDIWYVASPSGPNKFVQIIPLGPKMGPPLGSHVLHRLIIGRT